MLGIVQEDSARTSATALFLATPPTAPARARGDRAVRRAARAARIAQLESALARAESDADDPAQTAALRAELAFVRAELTRAAGRAGPDRKAGSLAERARST